MFGLWDFNETTIYVLCNFLIVDKHIMSLVVAELKYFRCSLPSPPALQAYTLLRPVHGMDCKVRGALDAGHVTREINFTAAAVQRPFTVNFTEVSTISRCSKPKE